MIHEFNLTNKKKKLLNSLNSRCYQADIVLIEYVTLSVFMDVK